MNRKKEDGSLWYPSQHSRICSSHFVGKTFNRQPSDPSYFPTIFPPDHVMGTSKFYEDYISQQNLIHFRHARQKLTQQQAAPQESQPDPKLQLQMAQKLHCAEKRKFYVPFSTSQAAQVVGVISRQGKKYKEMFLSN